MAEIRAAGRAANYAWLQERWAAQHDLSPEQFDAAFAAKGADEIAEMRSTHESLYGTSGDRAEMKHHYEHMGDLTPARALTAIGGLVLIVAVIIGLGVGVAVLVPFLPAPVTGVLAVVGIAAIYYSRIVARRA